jgi:D-alanyl-lipoteichoic acid acyltransferase DltB (MBOAT superfamily)
MLFNSLAFFIFLPIVFFIYWIVLNKSVKKQNVFLIISSYFFYGYWDWRFLILIIFSSLSDYIISQKIEDSDKEQQREKLLYLSVVINLATLFFFKYFNFFIENLVEMFLLFGVQPNLSTLNIILPVGISFYTFQSMSYTLDVYHKEIKPVRKLSVFLAYISFFPQLVAGPIERASQLIPQFIKQKREFSYHQAVDGLRQIAWGFVKKVVIADNCATFVAPIFENYNDYNGSTLFLGAFLFTFQIYGDFSGYSDIAIGTARLFGFELMENFRFPFFASSITDFWRRWHISLSSWLRDYLYTPLAIKLRNFGIKGIVFSTITSFTLIGIWHGANWTFITFGLLYGLAVSFELMTRKTRKKIQKKMNKKLFYWGGVFITFNFFLFSLVLFRSDNITHGVGYLSGIFRQSFFSFPSIVTPKYRFLYVFLLIFVFITIEWFRKNKKHVLEISSCKTSVRWSIYFIVTLIIITFARFNQNDFIYFQF